MSALATLKAKIQNRYQRTAVKLLARRSCRMSNKQPLISFTFDDFPRSALFTAGAMLEQHGFAGTYYTSLGLMGQIAPTGEMFFREDLPVLLKQGHELACHTYAHCHSYNTPPAEFEQSILDNQRAIASLRALGKVQKPLLSDQLDPSGNQTPLCPLFSGLPCGWTDLQLRIGGSQLFECFLYRAKPRQPSGDQTDD